MELSDPGRAVVSQTPSIRLHPIALRCVFDAIFPPAGFLDSSLGNRLTSPWCQAIRTRKALTLVCREWRAAALPFLYGEPILRRVGQLPAFAATIRSNPELFGPLIYSLSLSFHVPQSYRQMTENCTAFILRQCSNLRTLLFTSAFINVRSGVDDHPIRMPNPPEENSMLEAIDEIGSRITTFEYYCSDRGSGNGVPICLITDIFPNLVRLTLLLTWRTPPEIEPVLRLECLEDLNIWHTDAERQLCDCSPFLTKMELPKLKSLSLHWIDATGSATKDMRHLVKAHGRNVEFLDLSRHMYCNVKHRDEMLDTSSENILALISSLPSLSHIVLETGYFNDVVLESLQSRRGPLHIDIWTTCGGVPYAKELSSVRLLDKSLERCVDLPRLLPPVKPQQVDKTLPCVHRIFGLSILETESMITMCPNDMELEGHEGDWEALEDLLFNKWKWEPMGDEDSNDSDDSTFDSSFSSPSSITPSSYLTEDEEANALENEESDTDEFRVETTEEQALEIFRGIASHREDEDSGDEAGSEGESDGP